MLLRIKPEKKQIKPMTNPTKVAVVGTGRFRVKFR